MTPAGQIVAASLSAPVLFTVAEDLTKMELHVAVDEADIGRLSTSPARFDAHQLDHWQHKAVAAAGADALAAWAGDGLATAFGPDGYAFTFEARLCLP